MIRRHEFNAFHSILDWILSLCNIFPPFLSVFYVVVSKKTQRIHIEGKFIIKKSEENCNRLANEKKINIELPSFRIAERKLSLTKYEWKKVIGNIFVFTHFLLCNLAYSKVFEYMIILKYMLGLNFH